MVLGGQLPGRVDGRRNPVQIESQMRFYFFVFFTENICIKKEEILFRFFFIKEGFLLYYYDLFSLLRYLLQHARRLRMRGRGNG